MKSSFLTLNWKDLSKGLVVAALTVFVTTFGVTIEDGSLPTLNEIKDCALAAVAAGLAYILKNLVTNSDDKLLKPDVPNNLK